MWGNSIKHKWMLWYEKISPKLRGCSSCNCNLTQLRMLFKTRTENQVLQPSLAHIMRVDIVFIPIQEVGTVFLLRIFQAPGFFSLLRPVGTPALTAAGCCLWGFVLHVFHICYPLITLKNWNSYCSKNTLTLQQSINGGWLSDWQLILSLFCGCLATAI